MNRRPNRAGSLHSTGYIRLNLAERNGVVGQHILIAEKALGKRLPGAIEVHHFNGKRADNRNENLVICPNRTYHRLLHIRHKALEKSGHADWRMCLYCREYDDTKNLFIEKNGNHIYHRDCRNKYRRVLYKKHREAA